MAKKVEKPSEPDDSAAQAAEELAIISPDVVIPICGCNVTVTEYPFFTWLELKARAEPLTIELSILLDQPNDVYFDDVSEVFENVHTDIKFLIGKSINKPDEFFNVLSDADMQLLMSTWWGVNKHFFIRSAMRIIRAQKNQVNLSAGQTSFNV